RGRHERADRREQYRSIELLGRHALGVAGPDGAELECEALRRVVAAAREREHLPPLSARHLREQMRGGAEAVEAEIPAVARGFVRAIADQARAEQRCGVSVVVAVGNSEAVARVRDRVLRVAAVECATGEAGALAEILEPELAVATFAAREAEPGHADALAGFERHVGAADREHAADELV